jgi:hypothetical protein
VYTKHSQYTEARLNRKIQVDREFYALSKSIVALKKLSWN